MADESALQELLDRQRIWDCLLCYTRGVDRLDRELLLSGFHADAMIDQGSFKGDREKFADWVLGFHRENQIMQQHTMTNFACEIDRDVAHSEAYVSYYGVNKGGKDSFAVGRYMDRLERRNGKWGIVDRVCVTEGATDFEKNAVVAEFQPNAGSIARSTRDRTDPSYLRPLRISRD